MLTKSKMCFFNYSFSSPAKRVKGGFVSLAIFLCLLAVAPSSSVQANSDNNENTHLAGVDSIFNRPASGGQPIAVPPISFVDINSGRFGKLEIDLEDGQFFDTAVDKLHLLANNLDVQTGTLNSLDVSVEGGHIRDFIFDKLKMETDGDLKFDSGVLLNHRLLQFEHPAKANVFVVISQTSLNKFLNSPHTLERLSLSANRKANALAGLASLVGIKVNQIGLSVNSANVKLSRHDQFKLDFAAKLGMGELGLPIAGVVKGQLALQDGSLVIADTQITTNGQDIPKELSNFLLKKINLIPALSQNSEDIRFNFTDLKVVSGKQIQLRGIAYVSRLRFGNARN